MIRKPIPAISVITLLLAASGSLGIIVQHAGGVGAVLDTDRDQITLGQDLTITLFEPDANFDSRSKDRISLSVLLITTDKFDEAPLDVVLASIARSASSKGRSAIQTDHPFLLETDFNSGIFEVTLESINDLLVDRDNDIRITYIDSSPSGAGSGVRVEKLVHVAKASIGVKFSKKEYSPFGTVEVLLFAQMFNVDRREIDTLNVPEGGRVVVTASSGEVYYPPMFETGMNTGTFTGKVRLTSDPAYREGDLLVKSGERIKVTVTIVPGFEVKDLALVSSNLGSVSFGSRGYAVGEVVKLVVTDPDENKDPGAIDSVRVSVWSSTDLDGVIVVLREAASSSGIFEGNLTLAEAGAQDAGLQVSASDMILAKYYDRTVPSPAEGAGRDLFASASVGLPVDADIFISAPLLLDKDGIELQNLQVGRLTLIESSITNLGEEDQIFAYITHVKDADGFTAQLDLITGVLEPFQSLRVARSWIPEVDGEYTIGVVVWNDLADPSVLSPVRKITVSVTE